jgi:hypothetical protein
MGLQIQGANKHETSALNKQIERCKTAVWFAQPAASPDA